MLRVIEVTRSYIVEWQIAVVYSNETIVGVQVNNYRLSDSHRSKFRPPHLYRTKIYQISHTLFWSITGSTSVRTFVRSTNLLVRTYFLCEHGFQSRLFDSN